MLDRIAPTERHPRAAGTAPRARREQCAPAPWGEVRPFAGTSAGLGRLENDSEKQQRGRTGMHGALM